uniref:Acyl dehydratase n=1 Tax=Heterorhabditis bacteriophora TaxID=37862 RepID=A0A1I7XBU3_HETBA
MDAQFMKVRSQRGSEVVTSGKVTMKCTN